MRLICLLTVLSLCNGCFQSGGRKPAVEEPEPATETAISHEAKESIIVQKQPKPEFSPLPKKRQPPTVEQLKAIYYKLKDHKPDKNPPKIVTLSDDWKTKGDWIDRYGNYAGVLCAQAGGGLDLRTGYRTTNLQYAGWIGKNYRQKGDSLRYWVHWIESNDPRVLQCEQLGGRKQSEWDDHKEEYPATLDGPHIYGTFNLPPGKYLMSLYFVNKDGHGGKNRCRDYIVTIKTGIVPKELFDKLGPPGADAEEIFLQQKGGTTSRVQNFWGGVWKRFYVQVDEGESIMMKIDADYSYNTIVSAVMFDAVKPEDYLSVNYDVQPPRELTDYEYVLGATRPDYGLDNVQKIDWWSIKALDMLLYLRDREPAWYYAHARKEQVDIFRSLVTMKDGNPHASERLSKEDKDRLLPDVAALAQDLLMFSVQDKIEFGKLKGGQHYWLERTKAGRKNWRKVQWDWVKYNQFLDENQSRQTW